MVNKKLLVVIIWLLSVSALTSGCWDSSEVNNLAIVIGVGIDRIPGAEPLLVTVQIIDPSGMKQGGNGSDGGNGGGGGGQQPFVVKTSQGKTFYDAISNLSKELSRRIYFEHNKTVIFGKEFAKSGLADVLDHMERDKEFRSTNFMVVTEKTANEVLEAKMDIEKLPAESMEDLLKNNNFTYPITRNEFLLTMKSIGVSTSPLVQLVDRDKEVQKKLKQATKSQTNSSGSQATKKINVAKTTIFKNYRVIGVMTENESKDFLWFINEQKVDTVVIPYKTNGDDAEVTIDILEGSSTITPKITAQRITMEIQCKGKAIVREAGNTGLEVKKQDLIRQLELKTEKMLKSRMEQTIEAAQKRYNADFIGFGNHLHNQDPVVWRSLKKDWDKYFPQIKYQVNVQIKIVNVGIFHNSINEQR